MKKKNSQSTVLYNRLYVFTTGFDLKKKQIISGNSILKVKR